MADVEKAKKRPAAAKPAGAKAAGVKKRRHTRRNYDLGGGVYRFSKSRMYAKRALYSKLKKGQPQKGVKPKGPSLVVKKPIGGDKNGGERLVRINKLPRYYPTEAKLKKPKTCKTSFSKHKRYLRKNITPGSVLIIVAGKHRGKRVVFLKQLKSGLLLVTGPFKLNACPLRRINQIFVIATRTKLDISKVKIPGRLNDDYFKRRRPKRPKKDEGEIFETKKESYQVSDERKKDQIDVDRNILEVIRQHPEKKYLFGYLGATFSLRNNMFPHKMIF